MERFEAEAKIAADVLAAKHRATAAQEYADKVAAVRITVQSSDNTVSATVDSEGNLIELDLTNDALEYIADDLAAIILETVIEARQASARRLLKLTEDVYEPNSPTTIAMRDELLLRLAPHGLND